MSLSGSDGGYVDIDPELEGEVRLVADVDEDRGLEEDAIETNRCAEVGVGQAFGGRVSAFRTDLGITAARRAERELAGVWRVGEELTVVHVPVASGCR